MSVKSFYERYWKDEHIKVNPFDYHPCEWTKENFEYHINFFKPFVRGKLLDYGCGDGQFLHLISPHCEYVCGVDVSKLAVEKASIEYPKIEFQTLSDSGRIPYSDKFFDTICLIDVLEHILDIETLLEELYRILKPKGNLLIATTEITKIKLQLIALTSIDNYFYPTSPHIRYFTRKNLANLLKRKGFEVVRYKKNRTYFGFIPQGQMVVASKYV